MQAQRPLHPLTQTQDRIGRGREFIEQIRWRRARLNGDAAECIFTCRESIIIEPQADDWNRFESELEAKRVRWQVKGAPAFRHASNEDLEILSSRDPFTREVHVLVPRP